MHLAVATERRQHIVAEVPSLSTINKPQKFYRDTIDIPEGAKKIQKAYSEASPSNMKKRWGMINQPQDFYALLSLETQNEYHSTCIDAKVAATVGLGFLDPDEAFLKQTGMKEPADLNTIAGQSLLQFKPEYKVSKADEVLNPLTNTGWQQTLMSVASNYFQTGVGYLEVVRDASGVITGLHFISSQDVWVYVENNQQDYHFCVRPQGADENYQELHMACYGDKDRFIEEWHGGPENVRPENVSELIQFVMPSATNRYYGKVDWLAAVPHIELANMATQWRFDFFQNRGVPDYIFVMTGSSISKEDWDNNIKAPLQGMTGQGNAHKSVFMNVDQGVKVEVIPLGLEGNGLENIYTNDKESIGVSIVTAHRLPPLLAGILIPGKLGASNELPNALRSFQSLYVAQHQKVFKTTLSKTLGDPESNGGLGLTGDNFNFITITDALDLERMDVSSRMRQTEASAQQEGRNLEEGLRD